MRNGGHILDEGDLQPCGLQCTNRCFSACTRALYIDLNRLEAMLHGSLRCCLCRHLRRKRGRLSGAAEPKGAGAGLRLGIALHIGHRYNRIIERRTDMGCAALNILFLSAPSADFRCFSHRLSLLLISSCPQLYASGLFSCAHSSWCADRERAGLFCDEHRVHNQFPSIS